MAHAPVSWSWLMLLSSVSMLPASYSCLMAHAPVSWSWLMLLYSVSMLLLHTPASWLMLLSPDPDSCSFLLSPCFLLHTPVSWLMLLSPDPGSCSFLLSPCFLLHTPASWLMLLSPDPPFSCLLILWSPDHTVLSPLTRTLWSCLLSPGAASFFVLWLSLTWLSCLLILPMLLSLPLASCLLSLAPVSCFLPHCSFHMIMSQGPLSCLCLLSPASHPKVLSTFRTTALQSPETVT